MQTFTYKDLCPRIIFIILWAAAIISPELSHSQSLTEYDISQSNIINASGPNQSYDNVNLPEGYEYPELLTVGKSWVIWHGYAYDKQFGYPIDSDYIFYVSVDGEEIIDGITCKRIKSIAQPLGGKCVDCLYGSIPTQPKYYYGYEQDRKIYFYRNPGYYLYYKFDEFFQDYYLEIGEKDPYFDLYMDLNKNLGDNAPDLGTIDKIEYKNIGGKNRRIITSLWPDMPYLNYERNWIEGIGSNSYASDWKVYYTSQVIGRMPPANIRTEETIINHYCEYLMVMCCENGVPIYDNRATLEAYGIDLSILSAELSGVQEVQSALPCQIEDSKIYNLQGLEVTNPQKGQIYIRNGKKILF